MPIATRSWSPGTGPAALAMTDGRWVVGGLDRNGLRPMRYVLTGDGLLIAGSEAGMVPVDEMAVREKGALGPGQMIAVDMAEGKLYRDWDLKDKLAASQPFGDWVQKVLSLNDRMKNVPERALFEGADLRRRQIAAGYTLEELEQVLAPMAEDGKEMVASMGDDTPPAVLSSQYRPLSHYFRQNFSQVTNPPIDSLRESRVMSLKTRFGNLTNVLAEDSSQSEILVLESPFIANAEFDEMVGLFGDRVAFIDCTFPADGGEDALRAALERVRAEAEDAVRSGAGHLVLDRPASERDARRHADDPGDERGAQLADAQGAQDLHFVERARGRMHRPPLFRRPDRVGCDDGQRLSGAGFHRRPAAPGAAGGAA